MTASTPLRDRFPEAQPERPTGWWGALLTVAVLATIYAALYFSYVYVRVAHTGWPPDGLPRPALGVAGAAVLVLLGSGAAVASAHRAATADSRARRGAVRAGLALGAVLGVAHAVLVVLDWGRTPLDPGAHAYASLFYVLPGLHLALVGVGVVAAAIVLALSWHAEADALVLTGVRGVALYWYALVVGGAVLLAVVYLVPYVWPTADMPGGVGS